MFEGGADQATFLIVLAAGLGGFAGTVLSEVIATVRHRRIMRRLDGPPEVPPPLVKAGCAWHREGGYGHVWTCPRCQEAAAREAEPELDRFARDLLADHELGEHEDGDHWLCRACQIREATVIDAGQGLFA